jgi:hypothetical protein
LLWELLLLSDGLLREELLLDDELLSGLLGELALWERLLDDELLLAPLGELVLWERLLDDELLPVCRYMQLGRSHSLC